MLKESQLEKIQSKIGYTFKNPVFLSQAFTRRSWAVMNGTKDNEVLEFFGDRILDFAVIRDFYEQYGMVDFRGEFVSSKSVGEFCKMDIELVKNAHLAEKIGALGFTKFIKVGNNCEKYASKAKADLFEAILGAVAVDSDWNLAKIQQAYRAMMYNTSLLDCDGAEKSGNIFARAEEAVDFFETEIWKHDIFKTENEYLKTEKGSVCRFLMRLNGKLCEVTGFGKNDHEAKINASEKGYRVILMIFEKKLFDDMRYIDHLYLLKSCGVFGYFDFHYEFYPHSARGEEDLWRCYGSLRDSENEFIAEDSTMNAAQETVAYAILSDALGIDESDEGISCDTANPLDNANPCDTANPCENCVESDENSESVDGADESSVSEGELSEAGVIHGQGLLKLILSKYKLVA